MCLLGRLRFAYAEVVGRGGGELGLPFLTKNYSAKHGTDGNFELFHQNSFLSLFRGIFLDRNFDAQP